MKTIQITVCIQVQEVVYQAQWYAEEAIRLLEQQLPHVADGLYIPEDDIFINTDYHIEEN
jgi:predicted Rdx family selenoprotein